MSESDTPAQAEAAYGRFVWHDLMTTDVESAKEFYKNLLGWDVRPFPIGDGTYDMIFASSAEDAPGIGGFEKLPPDVPAPSHWLGYVEVENVDDAHASAGEAGGSVIHPPTDIPTVGRFCVINDPEGGCFAAFQSMNPRQPDPEPGSHVDGSFVWNELMTRDTEGSAAFYPRVTGWTRQSEEMPGPEGSTTYHMWMRSVGGETVPYFDSGMMQMPESVPGEVPAHWLHYVQVADVDATAAKAKELGAAVHCEPTDIPNIGRFAVIADPQGATFAVFKSAPKPDAS